MKAKKTGVLLWIAQVLLAALFLFAGGMKLSMPTAALKAVAPMPVPFLRFIAVMELLGAAGLLLPGIFRIRKGLTPLAAAGLTIILVGATVITLMEGLVAPAILPFVAGLVAASVAYGRRDWATRSTPSTTSRDDRTRRRAA